MLDVKNLNKSYKNHKVLDDVSFSIKSGEAVGLIGPNGAGKSTMISILSTILRADSGNITFNNKDIFLNKKDYLAKLGVVFQEIALYENLSGIDNLKFFAYQLGLRANELDKAVDDIRNLIAIDDKLKNPVYTYSGGMKRRLNIGVALLNSPSLLIMDEPTVGIDPQSRNHILNCVNDLKSNGMSILYTTHYMQEVEAVCDKFIIMDFGKVIAMGTKKEIYDELKLDYNYSLEEVFLKITGYTLRD